VENKTKAFDLDPCRIYIHEKDSYPRGSVKRDEKAALMEEIKKSLKTLRGEKGDEVIDKIFEKREIYHGPQTRLAPDLICLPREGYDLKGTLEKKEIFGQNIFTGMHTWDDAFCILPENISISKKPSIENLTDYVVQYYSE
jgi:predicted AlkP superfamily phosphohydrolase/phosphomutase